MIVFEINPVFAESNKYFLQWSQNHLNACPAAIRISEILHFMLIKHCKSSAKAEEIAAKREEGLGQLKQYIYSQRMEGRPDLKAALLLFIGKNKYEIHDI